MYNFDYWFSTCISTDTYTTKGGTTTVVTTGSPPILAGGGGVTGPGDQVWNTGTLSSSNPNYPSNHIVGVPLLHTVTHPASKPPANGTLPKGEFRYPTSSSLFTPSFPDAFIVIGQRPKVKALRPKIKGQNLKINR